MTDWALLSIFSLLFVAAMALALYPLTVHKRLMVFVAALFLLMVPFAYTQWGGWSLWTTYLAEKKSQQKVQEVLSTVRSPEELIDKLKAQLAKQPDSARGWYLLGRLYASQGKWGEANEVYKKAYGLAPNDIQVIVNYAQSQLQLNHGQFNEGIRALFLKVLNQDANQPDALAMLAMDAFMDHHYEKAIDYWQRLLKLVPPGSEDAKAIRKAVAKAQKERMKQ